MKPLSQINTRPLTRKELEPPTTLVQDFARIRNLLAGQASGMTLDHTLGNQLINLLLCKMYDERTTNPDDVVKFQSLPGENLDDLVERLNSLFSAIKTLPEIGSLFSKEEAISLTGELLVNIVKVLQSFELTHAKRDVIGEAFESFIGPSLRGNEGQFFTPRNVVELTCRMINPKPGEVVLDPACGTGGFLTQAIRYFDTERDEIRVFGIDKDSFLARVAAVQIGFMKNESDSWAFSGNSLEHHHRWPHIAAQKIKMGSIDAIMTNPPFGAKIPVNGDFLDQFELGFSWKKNHKTHKWMKGEKLSMGRPPQILFIERCLELLRPGGRLGIVLPDSVLGNDSMGYVRDFIKQKADIVAVIDLPLETFLPSTSTKTSLLFLRKKANNISQKRIFMAIAEKCGHDRRGKPTYQVNGDLEDDFPLIVDHFRKWRTDYAPDF